MNLEEKKRILHDYILLKLEENDLHGISDAANDLRVIEAYDAGMNAAIDLQRLQDKLITSNSGEISFKKVRRIIQNAVNTLHDSETRNELKCAIYILDNEVKYD